MRIFLNDAGENWICDRLKSEFISNTSLRITNSIEKADIVWLIAPWKWRKHVRQLRSKKVVCTIHHVDPAKFDRSDFMKRDSLVNSYHVLTNRTKDFIKKHTRKKIDVLPFWLDSKLWSIYDKEESRKQLGLSSEFVVGSFQRDTEGKDLISPKLSKGPDLFIKHVVMLNKLKPNLLVLLGGWRRQYVIKNLEKNNIRYKYLELASFDQINRMYRACDLYVVSSRVEGGPLAILEASYLETPIISNDVGIARLVLSSNCIFDVAANVYTPSAFDVRESKTNMMNYEISRHIKNYENLITTCP